MEQQVEAYSKPQATAVHQPADQPTSCPGSGSEADLPVQVQP